MPLGQVWCLIVLGLLVCCLAASWILLWRRANRRRRRGDDDTPPQRHVRLTSALLAGTALGVTWWSGTELLRSESQAGRPHVCQPSSPHGVLAASAWDATRDDEPLWGHACRDGAESWAAKCRLVRAARISLVMSLNYGGGEALRQWCEALRERLRAGVWVVVCAGTLFQTQENQRQVAELQADFPDRLRWQTTDWALVPRTRDSTWQWSANHTKALVVDGGSLWCVGGSGVQDEYVGLAQPRAAGSGWTCDAFRDQDWVMGTRSGRPSRSGAWLHSELLALADRWSCLEAAASGRSPCVRVSACVPSVCETIRDAAATWSDAMSPAAGHLITASRGWVTCPDAPSNPPTPGLKNDTWLHSLILGLRRARTSIDVAHLYCHWPDQVHQALVEALVDRHVVVRLVSNEWDRAHSPCTHALFVPRSRAAVRRLANDAIARWHTKACVDGGDDGCEAMLERLQYWEWHEAGTTYHKKGVVIDEAELWVGSSNLGDKSCLWSTDDEINWWLASPGLAVSTRLGWQDEVRHGAHRSWPWREPCSRLERVLDWSHQTVLGAWLG